MYMPLGSTPLSLDPDFPLVPVTPPEWIKKIDMRSRPGSKWQIMTYMTCVEFGDFTADMDHFDLFITFDWDNKLFEDGERLFVFFKLRPGDDSVNDFRATRSLTKLIHDYQRPIYWKENGMGYLINCFGHIFRKWKLDTVPIAPTTQA